MSVSSPVSEIDSVVFAPEAHSGDWLERILNELRQQLVGNDILVIDIAARESKSYEAVLVFITVANASHQRVLTAFEHFVIQAFRRSRSPGMNVLVYWRYQLPKQKTVQ